MMYESSQLGVIAFFASLCGYQKEGQELETNIFGGIYAILVVIFGLHKGKPRCNCEPFNLMYNDVIKPLMCLYFFSFFVKKEGKDLEVFCFFG